MTVPPRLDVRRSDARFLTTSPGITTRHAFSFGSHYAPSDIGHALLVAHNEDRVAAGSGYPTHPHRDLEIVTWVVSGALRHQDSSGHSGVVEEGTVQRMSAGSGVEHAEWNDAAAAQEVRFVQMWVLPDEPGGDPSYSHAPAPTGETAVLASGLPSHRSEAAVSIAAAAALHLQRLQAGRSVDLPEAPYLHVFVVDGTVELEGAGVLATGDTARFTSPEGVRVTAQVDAEVLVWELHRDR
ncbi:MAG: pirin family protein [Nocardioidaceae bacterium]|nr:pirin family protein [Nocardioidaceae bacterium]